MNRVFQRVSRDPLLVCLSNALVKLISDWAEKFFSKEPHSSYTQDLQPDFCKKGFVPLTSLSHLKSTSSEVFLSSFPTVTYTMFPFFYRKRLPLPDTSFADLFIGSSLSVLKRKDLGIPREIGYSIFLETPPIENSPLINQDPIPVRAKDDEAVLIDESVESISSSLEELVVSQLDQVKGKLGQDLYSVLMEMCGNQIQWVTLDNELQIDGVGYFHYQVLLGGKSVGIPVSSETILRAVPFSNDVRGKIAKCTLNAGLKFCSPKITIPRITEFWVFERNGSITMQFTNGYVKLDPSTRFAIEGIPGFPHLAVHEISLNQKNQEVSITISGDGQEVTAPKTVEEAKQFWKAVWAADQKKA